jgi:hypothetical protein
MYIVYVLVFLLQSISFTWSSSIPHINRLYEYITTHVNKVSLNLVRWAKFLPFDRRNGLPLSPKQNLHCFVSFWKLIVSCNIVTLQEKSKAISKSKKYKLMPPRSTLIVGLC